MRFVLRGWVWISVAALSAAGCVASEDTGEASSALDFGGGFGPGGSDAGVVCPEYCYCAGLDCPFAGAPECQDCGGGDSPDAGGDSGTSPPGDPGGGIEIDSHSGDGPGPSSLSPACRGADSDPTLCQDCCDQLTGAGAALAPGFLRCCYSACAGGDGVQGIAECLPDDICDYLGLLPGPLGEFLDYICEGIGIIEDGTGALPGALSSGVQGALEATQGPVRRDRATR